MPFLPIKGVMIYNQIKPLSANDYRVARLMRATHDTLRRLCAVLFAGTYWGVVILLFISQVVQPSRPLQGWQLVAIGVAIVGLFGGRILMRRDQAIEKLRDTVFKGEYRLSYVVPLNYSYQVLFTPAMCKAMQDPTRGAFVCERVDALLRNGMATTYDEWVRENTPSVTAVGHRFEGKIWLIEKIELLSSGLGIDQTEHFEALRTAARKKLQQELDEALKQHDEDAALLAELRQLR